MIAMMLAVTDIAVVIAATILYVTCLICFISNGDELSFIRHGFGWNFVWNFFRITKQLEPAAS